MQQLLLPPSQQWQWQVQYMPVCSTAGAVAAAAENGQTAGASLTAGQLLQLLVQQQSGLGCKASLQGGDAGGVCKVLLSAADRRLLEAAMHATG
jgi:hypothetical protein